MKHYNHYKEIMRKNTFFSIFRNVNIMQLQFIFCIIVLLTMNSFQKANAQNIDISKGFNSLDQAFVYEAIQESVLILRQDYVIVDDNGKRFGRDNKDYYGTVYFIGIAADNRIWCSNIINSPWLIDATADYSEEFKPEVSKLYILNKKTKQFDFIKRSVIEGSEKEILQKMNLYYFKYDTKGIEVLYNYMAKDGWVVLAYTDVNAKDADIQNNMKWAIFKRTLSYKAGENSAIIENFPAISNVIGGAFVVPFFHNGNVTFKLSGLIDKKVMNWYVTSLPQTEQPKCKGWLECWKEKRAKNKECRKKCK